MTEASHLRTLRVLDLIFYQRMKKENLMPREELARLFPNLPELIEIHSEGPSPHLLPPPHMPVPAGLQVSVPSPPHTRAPWSSAPRQCSLAWKPAFPFPWTLSCPALVPRVPSEGGAGSGHIALPQAPVSLLSVPDSWCEAMRKLREEGPIVKDIGDLMLARVCPEETGPLSHGCTSGGGGYGAGM